MLGLSPTAAPRQLGPFDRLYQEHFRFVWSAVRSQGVPAADIEDVVQEVFLVVVRRVGEFEGRSTVRTWIHGIARRIAHRYHRTRTRRARRRSALEAVPRAHGGESDVAVRYCTAKLDEFLDELGDLHREVFVLAELEQMQGSEIARALGVNQNTVYARLRTARRHFANRFMSEDCEQLLDVATTAAPSVEGAKKRVARALAPVGLGIPKAGAPPLLVWFKAAVFAVAAAGAAAAVAPANADGPERGDEAPMASARPAGREDGASADRDVAAGPGAVAEVTPARTAEEDAVAPEAAHIAGDARSDGARARSGAAKKAKGEAAIRSSQRTRSHRVSERREGGAALGPDTASRGDEASDGGGEPRGDVALREASAGIVAEVGGLKRARAAMRDRRYGQALELLRALAREFPRGRLQAERVASLVEVYCVLGRTADAQQEARRLARSAPENLALADRIRHGCAASALDDVAAR